MRRRLLLSALLLPLAGTAGAQPAPLILFDAHEHLVSQDEAHYPRIAGAVAAGQAPGGAPPPGAGVIGGRATPLPTAEAVLGWWGTAHVEAGAAVQKRGTYGFDNSYILDSAALRPGQFRAVVMLDPVDPATPGRIRALAGRIAALRFSGALGADGTWPWLSSPAAHASWEAAQEAGLPIELMTTPPGFDPASLAEIMRLSDAFPHLRIVIDHLGWPPVVKGARFTGFDHSTYAALAAHKRIFYKFTTINHDILAEAGVPVDGFLRAAVDRLGADHIMWGSDMGNSAGTYPQFVGWALQATALLTPAERKAVLHDTGAAFFKR
ncbi:amidohydrolase family protein [Novosphingobium rosa]|uniref:amidohydrolase family protein n=1 Tax=Novosphingobium rosa TaxID=76978 RepID=UPI000830E492|nr:amidohydrolase family protein [Novosphingobium rosa]